MTLLFGALAQRIAREPMTWFALIGAVLFAITAAWGAPRDEAIRISAADVAQLRAYWQAQAQRPPSAEELQALIEERINEEALAREAIRLGLDRDDVIIRRRLAQKLTFLNDDVALVREPTPGALRAYFETHAQRYAAPDRVSFEHIYFSPEQRGARVDADAREALETVREHGAGAEIGDPLLLPQRYSDSALSDLAREYGEGFAGLLASAPIDIWSGPVESAFGLHLVRVHARLGATAPTFEDVAPRVRADFLSDARRAANAQWVARIRGRYRIVVEDTPQP